MTESLRPQLIDKGDALVQVAECLLATPPARLGPEAVARRAARRYTSAGDAYQQARLACWRSGATNAPPSCGNRSVKRTLPAR